MAGSDAAWKTWGDRDPYYGVLTDEKFRKGAVDSHLEEFFSSGETYADRLLARLESKLGPICKGKALDFGCGVGRITLPLAKRFNEAVGLDISPGMLVEARKNAERMAITNVEFCLSDDDLSAARQTYDLVHTYIVLQHIPVQRGLKIMDKLLERVNADGVISLHFSLNREENRLYSLLYWARRHIPGTQGLVNLVRRRSWGEPLMEMNAYSLEKVLTLLRNRGFTEAVTELEKHGQSLTICLAARRNE